ncbi:unnamed protein product [Chironomus riparius]|uniref:Sulfotransferase domain-containing protein n=1 Tax=Chironomus riparius TaxID=315576 RepID=A0A9N9WPK1_9DIPT|nr:unnamed protein product [Chironomus riparius]
MYNIERPEDEIARKIETPLIFDLQRISLKDDPSKFCVMPKTFIDKGFERIKNMKVFEDDIWIVTFPKCGTTWAQEMIWMIGNDLDYETSAKTSLDERFPFLEMSWLGPGIPFDIFEMCQEMPRPRYIKSHLPYFLLPDQLWTVKPKIVYVVRNAKDAAVSWYHHHVNLHGYQGRMEDFIEAFSKDLVPYSPINEHIIDFWSIKDEPNILFLFFEDMKKNLDQEVKRAMQFFGKDFSQEQIDKLCQHLSFESVRNSKTVNKDEQIKLLMELGGKKYQPKDGFSFIRKGKVGGYKDELSDEQIKLLDNYVNHPGLEKIGFEYKF